MTYALVFALLVGVLASAPFVRHFLLGRRIVTSLLSGRFDQSTLGRQLSIWFAERPSREDQRAMFVQVTIGIGCPSGPIADRLMRCIMEVWRGQGGRFGDLLAQEIDKVVVYDPPKNEAQVEQQRVAREALVNLKNQLRGLD
jgi:hypothetical protein